MGVDLKQYLPSFFQKIKEIKEILELQAYELDFLGEELKHRLADTTILTSTIQGIKQYEKLLGIKPDLHSTLEERRMEVLRRWCLILPYTYKKLLEQLQALTKENSFYIWRRFDQYQIEIHILNQTLATLHSIKNIVQDMIPANLELFFAGRYPYFYNVPISYNANVVFRSEFFPQKNISFLYLDGSCKWDGTYMLGGYKKNIKLDFYPTCLQIKSDITPDILLSNQFDLITKTALYLKNDYRFIVKSDVPIKKQLHSVILIKSEIDFKITTSGGLTVEKDLWFLDGIYFLDGSKPLDAEIFEL